jgi:hypothetical protein
LLTPWLLNLNVINLNAVPGLIVEDGDQVR